MQGAHNGQRAQRGREGGEPRARSSPPESVAVALRVPGSYPDRSCGLAQGGHLLLPDTQVPAAPPGPPQGFGLEARGAT